MEGATAAMDFTSLIEETLTKHRNEWLAYFRLQRAVIGTAFPFNAGVPTDSERWSAKSFRKAVEWATWNPTDLGRLIWWGLRTFLQRIGAFFGVRLSPLDDTSGKQYLASFVGNEVMAQKAVIAAQIGASMFVEEAPYGNGYLYRWALDVNVEEEIKLFAKRTEQAYSYLGVRLAAMIELARENTELGQHRRSRLIDFVTKKFGVNPDGAVNLIEADGLAEATLAENPEAAEAYAGLKAARELSDGTVREMKDCLLRARKAEMTLPPEYQRVLLLEPVFSKSLQSAARLDNADGYDLNFASELAVKVPDPAPILKAKDDALDLPFRPRRG
jgi:hypothetical protein